MSGSAGVDPIAGQSAAALATKYAVVAAAKQISALKDEGEQALKLIEAARVETPRTARTLDLRT